MITVSGAMGQVSTAYGRYIVPRLEERFAYYYTNYKGLRRGGLTPACDSVHTRHRRGCRQIEPTSATVLPSDASRNFNGTG